MATTLDTGALQRGWDALGLIDADRYKVRVFKRAKEILDELGLVDPIAAGAIRSALRQALTEVLKSDYPAPPPRARAVSMVEDELRQEFASDWGDEDPESLALHASAMRWLELGDQDVTPDNYVEAVETIEAYR